MSSQIQRRVSRQPVKPFIISFNCRVCNIKNKRLLNEDESDEKRRADMYKALMEIGKFSNETIPDKCSKSTILICMNCEIRLGKITELKEDEKVHLLLKEIALTIKEGPEILESQDWIRDLRKWIVTEGNDDIKPEIERDETQAQLSVNPVLRLAEDSSTGGTLTTSSESDNPESVDNEEPTLDAMEVDVTIGDNSNARSTNSNAIAQDEEAPVAESSGLEDRHNLFLHHRFNVGGVDFQSATDGKTDRDYLVCTACRNFNFPFPNSRSTNVPIDHMEVMTLHVRRMHND